MSRRQAIGIAGTILLSCGLAMAASNAQAACTLQSSGSKIKRVIHITFDNVHLRRDNPNVPSDLEQMPNLLGFLQHNGIITGNHRTPLISHTANDILTALTGVYGDRHGVPVSNSYGFFRPNGSVGFSSSFLYWTSPSNASVANGDGLPNMLTQDGKNHPAPWVPFTRAGCDVGAYSVANMEFETVPGDVQAFFGASSPQATAITTILNSNPNDNNFAHQKARQSVNTDWLGIAVHCAQGSPLCTGAGAAPDTLPDEPGGYTGFNALFGSINVAPAICQGAPAARCDGGGNVKDINGNVITDAFGRPGFPNTFSPTAAQSLGYAAAMLERGIPVVYIYIADAHDRNPLPVDPATGRAAPAHAFGPGEAEYVAQLKAYDDAFGKFFARLAANGITRDNTLFVVVPDENDHFVGSQPTPVGCDGIHVPCNYTFASEINASLNRLLLTQRNNATSFSVHNDDAPTLYITGNPAPTASVTRALAHDLDALTATNPITGRTDKLSVFLADQAEMKLLHMVTASPARTPTLTMFGDDNYFFSNDSTNANVPCTQAPACVSVPQAPSATFAYNHGDFQRDITRSWMGLVGPGVRREGRNDRFFSDHTDVRPTMLALLGLKDSYVHDGRVMAEWLDDQALPNGIRRSRENFIELATRYKQLNATLGSVGRNSLRYANKQVTGPDTAYGAYLTTIGAFTASRDALAGTIKTVLNGAAFGNQPVDERQEDGLGRQASRLIDQMEDLANGGEHRRADRDHDRDRDGDHGHDHD
jgi:hypothetical protein